MAAAIDDDVDIEGVPLTAVLALEQARETVMLAASFSVGTSRAREREGVACLIK